MGYQARVVLVSRVVWDWVLPWLVPWGRLTRAAPAALKCKHAAAMCVVAEAMFPLVPRVCSSLLAHNEKRRPVLSAAAGAGSPRCISWVLKHNNNNSSSITNCIGGGSSSSGGSGESESDIRRRGNKDFMEVLEGLCAGGHLGMAQRLIDGNWPGLTWWNEGGASGASSSDGIEDYVRDSHILRRTCASGHSDVAKWLIEKFNIRETWEFTDPLVGALKGGHLELAQWLTATFDLVTKLRDFETYNLDVHYEACKTGKLDVLKWCFDTFPLRDNNGSYRYFAACMRGKTSNYVEACQYVQDKFDFPSPPSDTILDNIQNVDVLKWVKSALPVLVTGIHSTLSNCIVEKLCRKLEGAKYIVEACSIVPTPMLFRAVCRNPKGDIQPVKWLSTRVTCSPVDLEDALIAALAKGNIAIASWLDETFNILKLVISASAPKVETGSMLLRVCKEMEEFEARVEGIEWLLNRLGTIGVQESFIVDSVEELLFHTKSAAAAMFLIDKFSISDPRRSELMFPLLNESVQSEPISHIKRIISMGEFSKETVAPCLKNPIGVQSAKTVRWLITHFRLDREDITQDNNCLLFRMLSWRQKTCAEWLITNFHITLEEVLSFTWEPSNDLVEMDLSTWKMILRMFPGITAPMIKEKFLFLVCQSPVIAQYTMKLFPEVTLADLVGFCAGYSRYDFPPTTCCWLQEAHPLIWDPFD
ncbi:hypothetical protein Pelo_10499 [Pelomyxa schiedti]|nr:hypothetical protein Pelo_10499 [Pelomyxa schiedti]